MADLCLTSPSHILSARSARFRWILILAVALATAVLTGRAVTPPEPSFVQISEEQGLSHSNVRAITQDRQGFIWLGTTQGGLNRFDGYEIKAFRHDAETPGSIASNFIWSLLVDQSGALWIGTDSGLDRFNRSTETFTHFSAQPGTPGGLPNASVLALFEDRAGNLWLGTRAGLVRMDREQGTFVTYTRTPTVAGSGNANSIRTITEDPRTGLLWLGSSDGLAAFDPRTEAFVSFVHDKSDPESLCYNAVNQILIDSEGQFWVLTDGGLTTFKPTFDRVPDVQWQPPRQRFRQIRSQAGALAVMRGGLIDREGRLWVTSTTGLHLVDRQSGQVTSYRNVPGDPSSLADNSTYAVFEDRSGNLWVSTVNAGVCRMRSANKPFRVMRHLPGVANSLGDNRITSLCFDSADRLWVGTANGLNRYDAGTWTRFNAAGLPSNEITALLAHPGGSVWVGMRNAGLVRFDGQVVTPYYSPHGNRPELARELPYTGHEVSHLAYDRLGRLWVGARSYGLDYYDGTKFVHFAPALVGEPPRRRPTIFAALGFLDEEGRYWYGTESQGLVRLTPERDEFAVFLPRPEQPEASENRGMYFVSDDGEGGLWIGGASGLYRFDRRAGVFTRRYSMKDGLPNDAVGAMQRDLHNRLWLGTARGIVCLDPVTGHVRNYGMADGLPSNGIAIRASTQDRTGRLYFGTNAGVVSFHPDELRENPVPPPVVFTDFRLLDRPAAVGAEGSPLREAIAVAQEVRLEPEQSIFSIGFAALDFTAPEKNAYRFKMEGFDPDWRSTVATERLATYTNLPPGAYVFRVKASNSDGVWNETGASIRIVIDPPWWATWWFRLTLAASLVGLLLAGIRWRDHSILQRSNELEQQVSARTEQLRREVNVREQAQAALRESHAELERRVQERTAELAQANENLRAESVERQKVEIQLRQAQKMEAFGQLAGGVAHDFNNLLTVILGQCEFLRDSATEEGERTAALQEVAAAASSAANLTRQLLVFSRRQAMNPKAIDLNEVVAGVTKLLRRLISEAIVLESVPAAEALPVHADAAMLEQVLVNMAVNARDAMPHGGRITLATARCNVDAAHAAAHPGARPGSFVRCTVADTGQGIPAEVLPRIFEPFFTTKETGHGTGLGLATSLGIVQQHGGWIEVTTREGSGTVFRFYLPCTASKVEALASPKPGAHYLQGTATILLVEDQDPVRKVALRMLQRQGYRLLEAANAEEALSLWAQHRSQIALLITDIVMPGEPNGRELAAQLRAEAPALRVIVMTGYDPAQFGELQTDNAPWHALLGKPFSRDTLLTTVERVLGG